MGFERACSIIQNTKGFTDFSRTPSNYNTDVFRPLFDELERLSGEEYFDVYPDPGQENLDDKVKTAVAFRVIADHLRSLCFSPSILLLISSLAPPQLLLSSSSAPPQLLLSSSLAPPVLLLCSS